MPFYDIDLPCHDIDLPWHSHILLPLANRTDMERIFEKELPHDDSVNDRSAGSQLKQSQMHTQNLWLLAFGENFTLCIVVCALAAHFSR